MPCVPVYPRPRSRVQRVGDGGRDPVYCGAALLEVGLPFRCFPFVILALAALALPVRAEPADSAERPWGDTYSRIMFGFNQAVYDALGAVAPAPEMDPDDPYAPPRINPVIAGVSRMASNIVNEPMSVLAAAVAADPEGAARAAGRFAVNSTIGLLGFYDVATDWGIEAYHTDLGLALCARGVGEGPYLVIPFIGPRTLRDGMTDVVLTNILLYTAVAQFLPANSGIQTILIAETFEILADIAATRQIDTRAKALAFDDYEAMRDLYLSQRRARCAALKRP